MFLLWVLTLAVPIYGCSASVLSMLGPAHSHVAAAGERGTARQNRLTEQAGAPVWLADGWQAWSAWKALGLRHSGAKVFQHSHAHWHDGLQRHHHVPADGHDDLLIVGAGAAGPDGVEDSLAAAAAGSAMLPLALGRMLQVPVAACVFSGTRHAIDTVWRNAERRRIERPPRRLAVAMKSLRPTDKA